MEQLLGEQYYICNPSTEGMGGGTEAGELLRVQDHHTEPYIK